MIALIVFRIFLPTIVEKYVNKTLANIPGYYGQVEDIDIALIRGAYVIKGLYLNKVNAQTQVPYLNFPKTDISVEWKSLFRGDIVSEIIMTGPEVIYVMEDQPTADSSAVEDWTKALTDLVPLEINHFEVYDGRLAFVVVNAEPNVDLQVNNVRMSADNLRNVVATERTLPSPFSVTGTSIGNGQLSITGNINLIKEIPDMDLAFSLENVDAKALNDFSRHFAKIDFEQGDMDAFSEFAIADGFMKGYFKVLLTDSKLIGTEDSFFDKLWEGFVGFFKFVLKNQRTDTIAVKAPLEGDLNNPEVGILPTITSIFKNAFIQAFADQVDDEIEFEDAFADGDDELTRKEKRELKKEEKKKEKEEEKKKD